MSRFKNESKRPFMEGVSKREGNTNSKGNRFKLTRHKPSNLSIELIDYYLRMV